MSDKRDILLDPNETGDTILDVILESEAVSPSRNCADVEFDEEKASGLITKYIVEMMRGKIERELVNEIMDVLAEAYRHKYRHSYFSMSNAIYQNVYDIPGAPLEALTNNIQIIKDESLKRYKDENDVCKGFRKFYDHVMLEITRINDHKSNMDNLNGLIEEFNCNTKNMINDSRKTTRQFISRNTSRLDKIITGKTKNLLDEIEKLKDNIFSQLIAILGIFSAIIIVFFGGASIFTKVLEKLGEIEWRDAAPILSVTGFAMFNIIFMFLFIISRMIEKDIGARVDKNSKWNKKSFCRWIRRYPYMFFFNAMMFIIFIITA